MMSISVICVEYFIVSFTFFSFSFLMLMLSATIGSRIAIATVSASASDAPPSDGYICVVLSALLCACLIISHVLSIIRHLHHPHLTLLLRMPSPSPLATLISQQTIISSIFQAFLSIHDDMILYILFRSHE